MADYLEEYKYFLVNTKNSSENTIESYSRDVKQFFDFLPTLDILDAADVDGMVISKYVDCMSTLGKTTSTVTRSISSVRSFYQYMLTVNKVSENPAAKFKCQRVEKKLPEILTQKEIDALLSQPDISVFKGCRDKAMLELLYATGVRVTELVDINIEDINFQLSILYCHSEKSDRVIPVYNEAIKSVSDYLSRVRPIISTDRTQRALFLNMNGERLTRQGFWKIIKTYAQDANIKKTITPHTMRHSLATHLLENGAGLKDIKDMLGHSDISSTHVYSQLMKQKYATSYKKFHPKAGR